MNATTMSLEVQRNDVSVTRLFERPLLPLGPTSVRLRVDRYALTANTLTYAIFGDMLYWGFFPSVDEGWGRVPAIGWATIAESNVDELAVGSRYFGWFPMCEYVDVEAKPTSGGFRDVGPHRGAHPPVYTSFSDTTKDPLYEVGDDSEDRHCLLRGLSLTGFLLDAHLAQNSDFGAEQIIVLSASSKTALGFAQCAADRDHAHLIGVTGASNVDVVRAQGWYDEVVTYDDIDAIKSATTVIVDMSGDRRVLASLHGRLGDRIAASITVGNTHHDAEKVALTGGPAPQMFFAPTVVEDRIADWGSAGYQERSAAAVRRFVDASTSWLTVERVNGPEAAEAAYHRLHQGLVRFDTGLVASLHQA